MELFPITLPKSNICTETELYYRSSQPVQYEEQRGQLRLQEKTVLTLDTYFNCFSYQKYLQYTSTHVLEVHQKIQGEVRLRLMKAEQKGKKVQRTELLTQQVRREQLEAVTLLYDFGQEAGNGFLYLEVTALSQEVVLEPGYYGSPIPTEQINPTKLAAVICTYKREDYVKRNLQHLNQSIFAQPEQEIADHLEVFVVDNGKTLHKEEIETKQIRLFPNKNCGGSGGFTRGIIEALRRKEEFSHVLLMDDDILLESNILIKTIRFLQILRPEHQDLAIGGSMLRLDQMNVQHEAGGKWTGLTVHSILPDLDFIKQDNLIQMEYGSEQADFCGWWYCCIPLCRIDENNLPLPLFIKIDDIEYGMRNTEKILFINGVGVWHEPFTKKEKTYLHYYNVRNKLIVNAIHKPDWNLWNSVFLLTYYIGKILFSRDYRMIAFPLEGFQDYLKGPVHFMQIDSEKQNQRLLMEYKKINEQIKQECEIKYFLQAGIQFLFLFAKALFLHKKVTMQFRARKNEFMTIDFWAKHLEIEPE